MDRTPQECRDLDPDAISALHLRWTSWWSENQHRFPGGSKSI
jgi:hypothetical protein